MEKYKKEFDLEEEEFEDEGPLPTENAGSFGLGRLGFSLFNIKITADILGLSAASSWTHNSAMWIHLATSCVTYDWDMEGSISSKNLSSLQSNQA